MTALLAEDPLVVVAEITGAFGVRGEARVRSFTADPAACFDYGPLMDAERCVLLTPVRARPMKGEAFAVTAREARTREEWEALRGVLLHVPRSAIPQVTDADEVYVVDLIGLDVFHIDGRHLGRIAAVENFGAGDLLVVRPDGSIDRRQDFLLPFTREVIPEVDLARRRVTADPPEEYLPDGA